MPSVAGELARRGKSWVKRNLGPQPLDTFRPMPPHGTPGPHRINQKVCQIFVDGDNIEGHAQAFHLSYDLSQVIGLLHSHYLLEDESETRMRIAKVVVFRTRTVGQTGPDRMRVPMTHPYDVRHFDRKKYEPGYEDEILYRTAWDHITACDLIVFVSRDKGFAHAASQMRSGWNPFTEKFVDQSGIPKVLLVSTAADKSRHFNKRHPFIDLNVILRELGISGAP